VIRRFFDVRGVEQELATLRWRLQPDGKLSDEAQHAAAEARASVLNLIAVANTEAEEGRVGAILEGLSVHHPSRTLILLAQRERAALKLEATVSLKTPPNAPQNLATEQVLLHAHGPIAEHLASIVSPLLIPDLPVMLWWPVRPQFGDPLFQELTNLSDRLIVDSGQLDPAHDLTRLLAVAAGARARCAIGDFNWARLLPWRELVAECFDPPAVRPYLDVVKGFVIWSGAEGPDVQARLMAGWLVSRLRSAGVEPTVELHRDPGHRSPLVRIVLTAGDAGSGPVQFTVGREPGGQLSTATRRGGEDFPGRTVRVGEKSAAELLAMELTLTGHDPTYEAALAAACNPRLL